MRPIFLFFRNPKSLWPLLAMTAMCVGPISQSVQAHGYLSSPESRSYLCKTGLNTHCGAIQWEPQSVEGPDGSPRYPQGGPEDGTIAAAGSPAWSELNVQTPSRWYQHDMDTGWQSFQWTFTANHATRDWRYFITKPNWNSAEPLTRAAFEPAPFCYHDGGMARPPKQVAHDCYIPDREGYHVILAVWDVGDTDASFYNAIDIRFSGDANDTLSTVPESNSAAEVGLISGAVNLDRGDRISTVVFGETGEIPELNVELVADRVLSGTEAALLLARAINQAGNYHAGRREGDRFIPELGPNPIYAHPPIERIETRVTAMEQPEPVYSLSINVTNEPLEINESGSVALTFVVSTNEASAISATVYDTAGTQLGGTEQVIDGRQTITLTLDNARAGAVNLVVVARSTTTQNTRQETRQLSLVTASSGDSVCGATDPSASDHPLFSLNTIYTAGDTVSYEGLIYAAKWWTQGDAPGNSDAFELLSDVLLPYSPNTAYSAGDRVVYESGIYEAKWWNRGESPANGPWVFVEQAPTCDS